jgi:hypothetical protein
MERLEEILEIIKGGHKDLDGFKVMRGNIHPDVVSEWIRRDDIPIVFLKRKNYLKIAVSTLIAQNIGDWSGTQDQLWSKKRYPEDYYSRKLPILPLVKVRDELRARRRLDERYEERLSDYDRVVRVGYEDFYFGGEWIETLRNIQKHFGYSPIITRKMKRLMRTQRINDERSYLNIENVYEIERECGNDVTGRLFEGGCPLLL